MESPPSSRKDEDSPWRFVSLPEGNLKAAILSESTKITSTPRFGWDHCLLVGVPTVFEVVSFLGGKLGKMKTLNPQIGVGASDDVPFQTGDF